MTPRQLVNVFCYQQLHRVAQFGYARAVCFSLPTPLPKPPAGAPAISVDKERSAGSAIHQQRERMQLQRTNRRDITPQWIKRQARERARSARRREQTRLMKLGQQALTLEQES